MDQESTRKFSAVYNFASAVINLYYNCMLDDKPSYMTQKFVPAVAKS